MLGCPRNTVLSRVHRGHNTWRRYWSRRTSPGELQRRTASSRFSLASCPVRTSAALTSTSFSARDCWRAVQADRAARLALEKLREPAPAGLSDRVALAVTIASPGRRRGVRPLLVGRLIAVGRAFEQPLVRLVAAASVLIALAAGHLPGWRPRASVQNRPKWPPSPP